MAAPDIRNRELFIAAEDVVIITGSNIKTETSHNLEIVHQESTIRRPSIRHESTNAPSATAGFRVTLAQNFTIQYAKHASQTYSASSVADDPSDTGDSKIQLELKVLLKTIEIMTGKTFHFSEIQFNPVRNSPTAAEPVANTSELSSISGDTPMESAGINRPAPQIETITASRHYENERTGYAATGTVTTADGREININVQMNMSREFYEANISRKLETPATTDPLAVSWDGSAIDLTDRIYAFDLNSDGAMEQIAFVASEKGGFLAYDRNGDGSINDGTELIGPTQGDGFSELSAYDQDANGWIDGADSIYYDLSIWSKNANGEDKLIALADTGIGAIYLKASETPFTITTDNNETIGQLRQSSVYIEENGSAGIIQQVDLVG
jgi:hypothetical protein